jgi:hypothetical protein
MLFQGMFTAVANGISHGAMGVLLGAMIEYVMPADAGDGGVSRAVELATQLGLNGLAVYGAALVLDLSNDSTHGVPLSLALLYAQPSLREQVGGLSCVLQAQPGNLRSQTLARP